MRKKVFTLLCSFFMVFSIFSQENIKNEKSLSKEQLIEIFKAYEEASKKVFRKGATIKDVDKLYSFYTKDYKYNHPKYGGVYSREQLYKNTIKYLKKGSYDNFPKSTKVNMIVGLDMIVTEKKEEGNDEMLVTLYKFKGDKIYYIEEYW